MDLRRNEEPSGPSAGGWVLNDVRFFDGSEHASSREARHFVSECLKTVGASASWWRVLTGELTSNVMMHARTDFDVVVYIDDTTLRVEVHDGAAATDAFRELVANPPASVPVKNTSGRGWLLIGATSARFGLDDTPTGGKAVWFEVALDRQHPEPSSS